MNCSGNSVNWFDPCLEHCDIYTLLLPVIGSDDVENDAFIRIETCTIIVLVRGRWLVSVDLMCVSQNNNFAIKMINDNKWISHIFYCKTTVFTDI